MTYDSTGENFMDMMKRHVAAHSVKPRLLPRIPGKGLSQEQSALYSRIKADRGAVGAAAGFAAVNEDGSLAGPQVDLLSLRTKTVSQQVECDACRKSRDRLAR